MIQPIPETPRALISVMCAVLIIVRSLMCGREVGKDGHGALAGMQRDHGRGAEASQVEPAPGV